MQRSNRGGLDLANALARGEDTYAGISAKHLIEAIDATIADLTGCRGKVTEAMVRAHRDVDEHISSGGLDEIRTSDTSDPTARRAEAALTRPKDPIRATVDKLIDSIAGAQGMASLARASALQLLPVDPLKAREMLGDGPGFCANCGVPVWRTGTTRLIRGRCRPCYEYPRDHDGAERPKELWAT